jgi:hypothetical protein
VRFLHAPPGGAAPPDDPRRRTGAPGEAASADLAGRRWGDRLLQVATRRAAAAALGPLQVPATDELEDAGGNRHLGCWRTTAGGSLQRRAGGPTCASGCSRSWAAELKRLLLELARTTKVTADGQAAQFNPRAGGRGEPALRAARPGRAAPIAPRHGPSRRSPPADRGRDRRAVAICRRYVELNWARRAREKARRVATPGDCGELLADRTEDRGRHWSSLSLPATGRRPGGSGGLTCP